jgi:hypothetical protein
MLFQQKKIHACNTDYLVHGNVGNTARLRSGSGQDNFIDGQHRWNRRRCGLTNSLVLSSTASTRCAVPGAHLPPHRGPNSRRNSWASFSLTSPTRLTAFASTRCAVPGTRLALHRGYRGSTHYAVLGTRFPHEGSNPRSNRCVVC